MKMQVPKGMTEKEVVDTISRIANRLAPKFKFGYHDIDDIKQEVALFAWTGLEFYDNKRPLENFLYVRACNLLKNLKRDNFERPSPCLHCKHSICDLNYDCVKYDDSMSCSLYHSWLTKNSSKKNLMIPIGLTRVNDEREDSMKTTQTVEHDAIGTELANIINEHLPITMRADYLRMTSEIHVPKFRRTKIQETIREILLDHGYSEEETRSV